MTRYVVIGINNDGGRNATIHDTLDAAKQAVREYLTDPEGEPAQRDDEREEMERDLLEVDGSCVQMIRGSDAWKEWLYIAPLKEGQP